MKTQVNTTTADDRLAEGYITYAIARASDGRLWIVYNSVGAVRGDVYAAYSDDDGTTWTEEVVVSSARAFNYKGLSILIDSNDIPIVVYLDDPPAFPPPGSDRIRYVDRSGGSWGSPETIVTADKAKYVQACIDSGDNVHVIWLTSGNTLDYIKGVSGAWGATEQIDTLTTYPAIALDSSDQPHVCYKKSNTGYMKYRTTSWQAAETFSSANLYYITMALDSNDDVYVAFTDASADYLIYYNKRSSGVWGAPALVASPDTGESFSHPLIAIDDSDNVYIAYQHAHDAPDENVYYKKIISGVIGSQVTLDDSISRPYRNPSTYAALWAKYPSSSIVSELTVALLDETDSNANVFYVSMLAETVGVGGLNPALIELVAGV